MKDKGQSLCACGCGEFTNPGRKFIHKHQLKGEANPLKKRIGEESPNWKGGNATNEILWRNAVKKRDNYTCQNFSVTEHKGFLCAHHIKSRKEHPELIFDINNGITLCDSCHASLHGSDVSNQTKQKMSDASKGKPKSEEHKRNISASKKGVSKTLEVKKKISNSLKGKNAGENHPMYGKHHTEESRLKMSESRKKQVITEETKLKISKTMKGREFSDEHRKHLSEALLGKSKKEN